MPNLKASDSKNEVAAQLQQVPLLYWFFTLVAASLFTSLN
jgi:uncharacterized membrane protein YhfC